MKCAEASIRFVLFDWGDTLMSEAGPEDVPMADWAEVSAIEGARETIESLARRYTLAICTNATVSRRGDIERALARVGLLSFISEIFCYTELGLKKDQPEFWHAVLARLNAKPGEALMIGDSIEQDVLGPRRAGIRAVWFNWKAQAPSAGIDSPAIRALSELPRLLAQM